MGSRNAPIDGLGRRHDDPRSRVGSRLSSRHDEFLVARLLPHCPTRVKRRAAAHVLFAFFSAQPFLSSCRCYPPCFPRPGEGSMRATGLLHLIQKLHLGVLLLVLATPSLAQTTAPAPEAPTGR